MANRISGRPWVIDTPAGSTIWQSWIKIAHFEFTGYTGGTDTVVVNDVNGNLIWQAHGTAELEDQDSFKIGWVQGMIVPTLSSGKLLVYIE